MQPSDNTSLSDLSARERDILRSIVNLYSEGGGPVGSQAISKLLGGMSSATVRNIFALMEEKGLIRKAHCSSGRIPTDAGIRYFVEHILRSRRIAPPDKERLDSRTTALSRDPSVLLNELPEMLAEISHYTGFVLTQETRPHAIRHIDFVLLEPRRVLVILVDTLGNITNRMVEISAATAPQDLERLRNFINANLADRSLYEIKAHFISELHHLRETYEALLDHIMQSAGPKIHSRTSGETNVFDYLNAAETRQIKMLLERFRRNQFYLDLFDRVSRSRDVHLFIGAESDLFCSPDCAAVVGTCEIPQSEIVGVIGVIGPRWMNYGKIISIIDYARNLLISSADKDDKRRNDDRDETEKDIQPAQ